MHDDKLVRKIPFDVRRQLIRSMKKKWDEVNKEYQLLTLSLFNLDTVSKVIGGGGKDRRREFSLCCSLMYLRTWVAFEIASFIVRKRACAVRLACQHVKQEAIPFLKQKLHENR